MSEELSENINEMILKAIEKGKVVIVRGASGVGVKLEYDRDKVEVITRS